MRIKRVAAKPRRLLKIQQSDEDENRCCLSMLAGSSYMPKDIDSNPLGEDAHFIYHEKQTMGIADGVGGWAKKGVDAGVYARELMLNAVVAIHEEPEDFVDLRAVLDEAFLRTNVRGSSTACLLTLEANILHVLNVGDSGFILIRKGEVVYRSPVQQHRLNAPYQLGRENDSPKAAQEIKIHVVPGDIVVAGSDGLFDNVYSADIRKLVTARLGNRYVPPQGLAFNLARLALEKSHNTSCSTPFSDAATKMGALYTGGKVDDITVLVAYVVPVD